jgi:hypothetical protein
MHISTSPSVYNSFNAKKLPNELNMMPLLSSNNQESNQREMETRNYAIWASMFILVLMIIFVGFVLPWIHKK